MRQPILQPASLMRVYSPFYAALGIRANEWLAMRTLSVWPEFQFARYVHMQNDITLVEGWAVLEGRVWSAESGYRYGFNGKEKDAEFFAENGCYDFGTRIYEPVIGRWWSVDPKSPMRAGWSAYNSMRCDPIINIDPNGALDRKFEDYETGEVLGEIDDGVDETVQVTKNDFEILQKRYDEDVKGGSTELLSYNEMMERYSIGKIGYDIAQTALKYEGSLDWDYGAKKDNFGENTYKCNKFVQDVLSENGAAPAGAWPPLAGTWAKGKVVGFSSVTNGLPNLGDVIAGAYPYTDASGHVVIVTQIDLETGYVQTMGTVHSNYIGDDGFGNDLINNGGLHEGKTYSPVGIKRFIEQK
jgi:RHS repeat-associated protein